MSGLLSEELRKIHESNAHPIPAKQYLDSQLRYDRMIAVACRRHSGLRLDIDHYQNCYPDIDHMSILKEKMEQMKADGFVVNLVTVKESMDGMEEETDISDARLFLDIDWEDAESGVAKRVFERMCEQIMIYHEYIRGQIPIITADTLRSCAKGNYCFYEYHLEIDDDDEGEISDDIRAYIQSNIFAQFTNDPGIICSMLHDGFRIAWT